MQVSEMNEQLQRKVRELTAIINLGKAVISITDQKILFQKIVDGAAQVANTGVAWLLVRDQDGKTFLLAAHRGLPDTWAGKMNKPVEDGLSSLVALSGETLAMAGDPHLVQGCKPGQAGNVVPIKVHQSDRHVVVVRKQAKAFTKTEQTLLAAVSDYASISLVNARLFRALHESAQSAKEVQRRQNIVLENIRNSIAEELHAAIYPVTFTD
jgi:transcriptional regulator with GAF, ATPase, and Fis domain